jgi:hypothetical protein
LIEIEGLAEYRRQIVTTSVVAIVLALSIGIGIYYIQPQLGGMGTTSTTTIFNPYPTNEETTNATLGLELELSAKPTNLVQGNSINITVAIRNTLNKVNNVPGESDWAVPVIENFSASTFACPHWENFLIFQGYYSVSNISEGSPVWLVPPHQAPLCPYLNYSTFSFNPESLNVSVNGELDNYNLTTKVLVEGYYTTTQGYVLPNRNLPPPSFPPGVYTVAAGDEWGQLVLLHFSVTPHLTPPSGTSVSTSNTSTTSISVAGSGQHFIDTK